MNNIRLITLTAAILLFLYAPLSDADWTVRRITENSADDFNPQINNDGDIVWSGDNDLYGDHDPGEWEIFLRLNDGTITQVSDPTDRFDGHAVWPQLGDRITGLYDDMPVISFGRGHPDLQPSTMHLALVLIPGHGYLVTDALPGVEGSTDQSAPAIYVAATADPVTISPETLVWSARFEDDWKLAYRWNDSARIIADNSGDDFAPQILNREDVYYLHGRGRSCIRHVNVRTNIDREIHCSYYLDSDYGVSSAHHVVWAERTYNTDMEIYHYSPTTGETVQITDNQSPDREPDINNSGHVVWAGFDGRDYEIFLLDSSTGGIFQLTDNAYDDRNPKINDHNDVVWEAADGDPAAGSEDPTLEIYLAESYKGPAKTWATTYGGVDWDSATSVDVQGDEYVIAGGTTSFPSGSSGIWVLRLDSDASILRQSSYDGTNGESSGFIEGGLVASHTESGNGDIHLLSVGSTGVITGQKTYGGPEADTVASMAIWPVWPPGFHKILAGATQSFDADAEADIWVLKLDRDGNVGDTYPGTWQKTYGTAEGGEAAAAVIRDDSGASDAFVVAGETWSFGAANVDIWVLKLDVEGNVGPSYPGTWQKIYGGSEPDVAAAIQQTRDGGYILAGNSFSFEVFGLSWDVWVLKLDADGEIEWQKAYGTTADDRVNALEVSPDGRYIMAGQTGGFGPPPYSDGWAMKIDLDGNILWQKIYSGQDPQGSNSLVDIEPTLDDGYIAVGGTETFGLGERDVWVLKMDQNGDIADCPAVSVRSWWAGVRDTSASAADTSATADTPAGVTITEPTSTRTETTASGRDECNLSAMTNLPRTGQSTSYHSGDDGYVEAGTAWPVPRFSDNGDGTLTDNLTGLMWLRDANCFGARIWEEAVTAVSDFNGNPGTYGCQNYTAGHSDWRTPNINELESLVNAEAPNQATWLNGQGFTGVQSAEDEFYWSSTAVEAWEPRKWMVIMSDGTLGSLFTWYTLHSWPVREGQQNYPDPNFPANVWKTGQTASYHPGDDGDQRMGVAWPTQRFTDNADGTVSDNLTGLMWLKDANCASTIGYDPDGALHGGAMSWESALDFVAGVNDGAFDISACASYTENHWDWRLPNRKELLSLLDRSQAAPALPSGHPYQNFPDAAVADVAYWSSTTFPSDVFAAWAIDIWWGWNHPPPKQYPYFVWLVRHGEDSDRDGLTDIIEEASCTDPYDADTDDDGIPDGVEDSNHNSASDVGETNPCSVDSDGDGIQDGTELGYTTAVPDPDGAGPLEGTDLAVFIPDLDPSTATDPLDADSDDDGLTDGEEDANADGSRAWRETDPMDWDTDGDLYSDWVELAAGTDPVDPDSHPPGHIFDSVINEVMTSYEGDSRVQFVEIHQPAMWFDVTDTILAAFDAYGTYLGDVLVLPGTPFSEFWTMGTNELYSIYDFEPDFEIPAVLPVDTGMLCWGAPGFPAGDPGGWEHDNPEAYLDCVAYGGYAGGRNPLIGSASPLSPQGHSLTRAAGSPNTWNNADDFFCGDPATPEGAGGEGFLPATTPCPIPAIYTLPSPLAFSGEGVSGSVNPVTSMDALSGLPDCTDLSPCLFPFGDTFVFSVTLDEGSDSVDSVGAWPFSTAIAGYFPDDEATGPSPISIFEFGGSKGHRFREVGGTQGEALFAGETTEVLFVGSPTGSIASASPPDDQMRFRIGKSSDGAPMAFYSDPVTPVLIPEPASALLALATLGSLAVLARRRRRPQGGT